MIERIRLNPRRRRRLAATLIPALAFALPPGVATTHADRPAVTSADYSPDELVVTYRPGASATDAARVRAATGTAAAGGLPGGTHLLRLPPGRSVAQELPAVAAQPGVASVVPNYRIHAAQFIPNDPGYGGRGGWQRVQWNFTGPASVNAPAAWELARHSPGPGGRGVTVAVIDSGVAFENYRGYRRSPDLYSGGFVSPYDFLRHDRHPVDREDHGTHIASTIAEKTNNGVALTGLAYDARIMPLRVLNANGNGDGATLARAIRYAVVHHAQVINLSVEVDATVRASHIPAIVAALRFANRHNVPVVAAAGNSGQTSVSYPAAGPGVIAVGATTSHSCLADYSNHGRGLTLVAPGGGNDAPISDNPYDAAHCNPGRPGREIVQETFDRNPRRFRLIGWAGTSSSAPHVTAAVALLIATRRLGPHPTPAEITARLEATARPLGPRSRYGAGLMDVAAALRP